MLIIERRAGEVIQIGDEIRLSVIDTDGDTVRLGIEAPRDQAVHAVNASPTPPAHTSEDEPSNGG